jgi:release factor glutamine methyltransferase
MAIALAKNLPGSAVTAVDVSQQALKVAEENAIRNHVSNIEWLEMDILQEDYFLSKEFDLIVSNPPYISLSEKKNLANHVVQFEPHQSLFVPDHDPLVFYRCIAEMGNKCLKKGGNIYVEINEKSGSETVNIFSPDSFSSIHLLQDMYGKDRFIKAVRL